MEITNLTDIELENLLNTIYEEKRKRYKEATKKYINNFCTAYVELVKNVPAAEMFYELNQHDIDNGEVDFLSIFVPQEYQKMTNEKIAEIVKNFIMT